MHVLERVQAAKSAPGPDPAPTPATPGGGGRGGLPRGMSPAAVMALQRAAGNTAVGRAIARTPSAAPARPVLARSFWDDVADTVSDAGGWVADTASDAGEWAADTASDAGEWAADTASDAGEWVADTASDAGEWVADTASDAGEWVADTASDAGEWVADTASDAGEWLGDAASDAGEWLGDAAGAAWDAITGGLSDLGRAAQRLGQGVVDWIEDAADDVRDAVTRWGAQAWAFIAACGTAAFEHLVRAGDLFANWVLNLPARLWRIAVHAADGMRGALAWLARAGGPILDAIRGVWGWVGDGFQGLLGWLGEAAGGGAAWIEDFLAAPSFEKLVGGMLGAFAHFGDGLRGLARWGIDGLAAAAQWIIGGLPALGRWLKEGLMGGLAWAGEMLILLLEVLGVGEALQFVWGLLFDLRPLDGSEQAASETVHPAGLIPYDLVRVDEEGLIIRIAQHFEPSTLAVTSLHVISANAGVMPGDLAAHELTHVGQYEAVGAMYMPEAIHAQNAAGYDYGDLGAARAEGKHFSDFNREQQAALCEAYYVVVSGGTPHFPATEAELDPFVAEMRAGGW